MRAALAALTFAASVHPAAAQAFIPVDEAAFTRLVTAAKGKVLLINFWATWCEPCRKEMPALAKLERDLRARGFTLITISADEPEQEADAKRFLTAQAIPAPHYIKRARNDNRFIDAIDPKWSGALPALFLFDRAGKKSRGFIGETDIPVLEAAIRKLL